jgi:transcriptional repressor NrdR
MKCPHCTSSKTQVVRTFHPKGLGTVERKRTCRDCSKSFWTIEVSQPPKHFTVIKRNGRNDTFSYEKLFRSIQLSCKDLNVKYSEQREVFLSVMEKITERSTESERISTVEIGELIAGDLEKVNRIAWLRYVAFYDNNEVTVKKRIEGWIK